MNVGIMLEERGRITEPEHQREELALEPEFVRRKRSS